MLKVIGAKQSLAGPRSPLEMLPEELFSEAMWTAEN